MMHELANRLMVSSLGMCGEEIILKYLTEKAEELDKFLDSSVSAYTGKNIRRILGLNPPHSNQHSNCEAPTKTQGKAEQEYWTCNAHPMGYICDNNFCPICAAPRPVETPKSLAEKFKEHWNSCQSSSESGEFIHFAEIAKEHFTNQSLNQKEGER